VWFATRKRSPQITVFASELRSPLLGEKSFSDFAKNYVHLRFEPLLFLKREVGALLLAVPNRSVALPALDLVTVVFAIGTGEHAKDFS